LTRRRLRRRPDPAKRARFLIYGQGSEGEDGNLSFRPFSRDGFLADLASAKAVMATAGFTLITEALHLGKPYLAMPMKGQFEQELNGLLLADLGFLMASRQVNDDVVGHFLYRIPQLTQSLETYERRDNSEITAKLDELLADDCALASEFHRKRAGG